VTGGQDLSLFEVNQAASIIKEVAHPDVNLIFGAVIDERMEEKMRITVIATGFDTTVPVRQVVRQTKQERVYPVHKPPAMPTDSTDKMPDSDTGPVDPFDLDLPTFLRKR
jgi:cell division protein FtsZ